MRVVLETFLKSTPGVAVSASVDHVMNTSDGCGSESERTTGTVRAPLLPSYTREVLTVTRGPAGSPASSSMIPTTPRLSVKPTSGASNGRIDISRGSFSSGVVSPKIGTVTALAVVPARRWTVRETALKSTPGVAPFPSWSTGSTTNHASCSSGFETVMGNRARRRPTSPS